MGRSLTRPKPIELVQRSLVCQALRRTQRLTWARSSEFGEERLSENLYEILNVPRDAAQSVILRSFLDGIPEAHPDFVVNGDHRRVRDRYVAFTVLSSPTDREMYDRALDGVAQCPWCGEPLGPDALSHHVVDHMAKKTDDGCIVCGRRPARHFDFRANSGRVLWHKVHRVDGNLCKTCATGVYRAMQTRNMTRGPWGIVSFFTTPYLIVKNRMAHNKRKSMPGPWPHDPGYDRGRGLGKPAVRSPAAWGSFVGVVAILVVVTSLIVGGPAAVVPGAEDGGVTSSSVAGVDGWVVGGCARFDSAGRVFPTECGEHFATVAALVPTSADCPDNTDFSLPLSEGVACFDQT